MNLLSDAGVLASLHTVSFEEFLPAYSKMFIASYLDLPSLRTFELTTVKCARVYESPPSGDIVAASTVTNLVLRKDIWEVSRPHPPPFQIPDIGNFFAAFTKLRSLTINIGDNSRGSDNRGSKYKDSLWAALPLLKDTLEHLRFYSEREKPMEHQSKNYPRVNHRRSRHGYLTHATLEPRNLNAMHKLTTLEIDGALEICSIPLTWHIYNQNIIMWALSRWQAGGKTAIIDSILPPNLQSFHYTPDRISAGDLDLVRSMMSRRTA
jgi:hypothetical protein